MDRNILLTRPARLPAKIALVLAGTALLALAVYAFGHGWLGIPW